MKDKIIIYCADIGSVKKKRFGWARFESEEKKATGHDINEFVSLMIKDIGDGYKLALGFECPLFVPISDGPEQLTSARIGEGNRAWCAGAGAGSLATGLTETFWILNKLRSGLNINVQAFLSWHDFINSKSGIFIWEAFVSGRVKTDNDSGDAMLAAKTLFAKSSNRDIESDITPGKLVRSLIGAALLQTGWTSDIKYLETPCLVIKGVPQGGNIS